MIVILIVLVFILTYDPKSGTLDKFLNNTSSGGGCANDNFRANNPEQCEIPDYNAVQFAKAPTAFMKPTSTNSFNGAIIRQ